MLRRLFLLGVLFATSSLARADDAPKASDTSNDKRLGKPKDYNGYFPWTPPTSKEAWEKRRQEVREQVLVANGLWPMPAKTPPNAVIHGKIERDGYTIEKVFFASYPGHYVTGNLYRPIGKTGKLPAVLNPHGHWANGRMHEAKDAESQMKQKAEQTKEGARYPLQARCAQLARMGCVAFFFDMVGYADSKQIDHRAGFLDVDAELRLQNFMGLQTYNCVRAFEFLASLPDVDPNRIGVTGASGGGTQTFILCAIDDRPAAAFPAVMVSTAMQGGCICENCSYLRVGTGNIELAGIFAPRPLGMAAANDWTKDIMTRGLPELKALYKLYGAPDNVMAKAHLEFGHNYNQVSREIMYNFFNQHLKLGQETPVKERPFVPVPPNELSVFDAEHPLPKDAVDAQALRKYLTSQDDARLSSIDAKEHRRIAGAALRAMITDSLPTAADVEEVTKGDREEKDGLFLRRFVLSRKGQGEAVQAIGLRGKAFDGRVVVWVHPEGQSSLWQNGKLVPAAQQLVDGKAAILAIDAFRTGASGKEKAPPVNKGFAGYTFGYNRPLVAERVHDILTAVAYARDYKGAKSVNLIGLESAGPWVVLARALCGDTVGRTAADLNNFRFDQIKSMDDDMMLPGALKYGGLPGLAALCAAPGELYLHNTKDIGAASLLEAAYRDSNKLQRVAEKTSAEDAAKWLLR